MADNFYPIELNATTGGFVITNNGTAPAPCKVTIIPKVDLVSLTITGLSQEPIVVNNVYQQEALVIDGENRSITIDDEDAFDHYNAWEFPKVQPGMNNITITNAAQMLIQIEYNTRYI